MDLGVLGPLQVRLDGADVVVPGAKERTLLTRLVVDAGRTVGTDELVRALWGEDPPRSAGKSLQTFVLRLRRLLEPDRTGAPSVLLTDASGYRLAVPADAVDAHRFARLAEAGRRALEQGRAHEAHQVLTSALAMWRGPALVGCEHTAFGAREASRLEELRLVATEDRVAASLELGGSAAAVPDLERLVAEHPYRERAWALLVLALYRSDRQSDALAAYERVRAVLDAELGVEPGPALKALHARVLAHDPTLRPAVGPAPRGQVPESLRRAAADGGATTALLEAPLLSALHEVVGLRGTEERVVLRGPRGAGRHRVALALAEQVAAAGGDVVHVTAAGPIGGATTRRPGLVVVEPDAPSTVAVPVGDLVLRLADADGGADLGTPLDADGGGAPEPAGPGKRTTAPAGAPVVRVAPLQADDVRRVLAAHHGAEDLATVPDVDQATVDRVLAVTGGRADEVHRWAGEWAHGLVVARVERAAGQAQASVSLLHQARSELRSGVEAMRNAPAPGAQHDSGRCPWPGLLAYDVVDADRFAGRERLVAECVARLAAPGVLGVVGASGSGKSSLVRAGVLAALAAGALPGSDSWPRLVMRPGTHPMGELSRTAIGAAARPVGVDDLVGRLLDTDGAHARTLLVVDQAEELWTTCTDPGERAAFLDVLTELAAPAAPAASAPGAVSLVLVVRADYVAELTVRPELASAVADCAVLVGPPSQQEVRRAVELPAARAGLTLDVGLVDALAQDAGEEPGVLPLLSTSLQDLWERRQGTHLTLAAYVAAGALSGAVARLAESTWQGLGETQQETARVLLTRLAGPGEGESVTRRRVPLTELAALARPDLDEVVQRLVQARLCTVGGGHVEVAHEALFREWPRLRGWLAQDAGVQQVLRRLTAGAAEWEKEARDPALLWRGARLQAAVEAVNEHRDLVTALERDFVAAGADALERERRDAEQRASQAQRSNRRLRGLLTGLAVLLVVAVVAGGLAVDSARRAAEARVAADAKRLAAGAVNEDYLDLALLSAVEAVRSEQAPETYGALLTLLAGAPELVTTVRTPDRFLRSAVAPDLGTVFLAENVNRVRAVAPDGTLRWTVDTWDQPIGISATPDGTAVVVGDYREGARLRVLDADTGEELWQVPPDLVDEAWVREDLVWLPGGELVVGGGDDLRVVDLDSRSLTQTIAWPEGTEVGWTVSLGDGRLLVQPLGPPTADGAEPPLRLVDTGTGEVRPTELVGRVLDVSDDGGTLLLARGTDGDAGTDLTVVGSADLRAVAPAVRVPGFVRAAAFAPDAGALVVATDDVVTLHDPSTALPTGQTLRGHSGAVMQVHFTAGGDRLWSVGRDGAAMLWDLTGRTGLAATSGSEVASYRGAATADGSRAVVERWQDGTLNDALLADPRTGEDLLGHSLPVPERCACQVWGTTITPDGSTALGGAQVWGGTLEAPEPPFREDLGHLLLWDAADGDLRAVVDLPWPPHGVAVTPDGRSAVVNGHGGWALVDVRAGRLRSVHEDAETVADVPLPGTVVASPDGTEAAVLRGDRVLLVGTADGRVLRESRLSEDGDLLFTGAWTPDGGTLVVGGFSGVVHVLDTTSLRARVPARTVNAGWLMSVAVHPARGLMASLGSEGDLLLWDTTTWLPMGVPVVDDRSWGWLRYAPEDGDLVAAYEDGARVEVPTDPQDWAALACRVAGRDLTVAEWGTVRPGVPWRSTCGLPGTGAATSTGSS